MSREEFDSTVQEGTNERATISAAFTDLRDKVNAQLAGHLAQTMSAIRTGRSSIAVGPAPGAVPSGGAAPGASGVGAPPGGALGDIPLPRSGLADFAPPGLGIAKLNAFAPSSSSPQGARHVLGSPQLGFGPYGGGPIQSPNQKRMEKLFTDQRVSGWSSSCVRTWWVIMGCFPPPTERQVLQGYMYDAIEVTNEVANMLITCRDFRPTAFNPRGAVSGSLPMATNLKLMAEAVVTIAGRGVADDRAAAEATMERVDRVVCAFVEAINMVERHTRENFLAMQSDHNRGIIEYFLVKDMQEYVRSVSVLAEHIYRANPYPPATVVLPPSLLTTFPHIRTYIQAGRLINSTVQGQTSPPRSSTRTKSGATSGAWGGGRKGTCRQFARDGNCRFGNRCVFTHKAPAGKRKPSGGGGGGHSSGGQPDQATTPPSSPKKTKKDGTTSGGGGDTGGVWGGRRCFGSWSRGKEDKQGCEPSPPVGGGPSVVAAGDMIPMAGATLLRPKGTTAVTRGEVGNISACFESLIDLLHDMSRAIQKGVSQLYILQRVAEECAIYLHFHDGRFECMQAIENGVGVPRVRADFIRFWFGRLKGLPSVEMVANIAVNGAKVPVGGAGDLIEEMKYGNHGSAKPYSHDILQKLFDDVRFGRAFIYSQKVAQGSSRVFVYPRWAWWCHRGKSESFMISIFSII